MCDTLRYVTCLHAYRYERLTPLEVEKESLKGDFSKIRKGDCVVCFSRQKIFQVKEEIEKSTGLRCAVVYGGLPPESGCCNTCEEVRQAYINRGWSFNTPDAIEQVASLTLGYFGGY